MNSKEEALKIWNQLWVLKMSTNEFKNEETKLCGLLIIDKIITLNIKYHGREIENNICNIEYYREVRKEFEKLP